MNEFIKSFDSSKPRETSILVKELVNETIIDEQEDEWELEA
ncbi:hypothetical protein [Tissierella sp. P1]|nr:hypothetical protein [Tissierella sp. P1]